MTPGAIGLAAALYALDRIGMDLIAEEEGRLIERALSKLSAVPDLVVIYGETDCRLCKRTGAISFNLKGTITHSPLPPSTTTSISRLATSAFAPILTCGR